MLDVDDLRRLNDAYAAGLPAGVTAVLEQLGDPSANEIVDAALAGFGSADRNVRGLMLRVLSRYPGAKAVPGLLAGLRDEQRRVREVAVQASRSFRDVPEIVERLVEIATDEREKRKIRDRAFGSLGGVGGGVLPPVAVAALETLAKRPRYRERVLLGLVQADLSEPVAELLRTFVDEGSAEASAMARRALAGERVVNLGEYPEKAVRRRIAESCDRAAGRVYYWVDRSDPSDPSGIGN